MLNINGWNEVVFRFSATPSILLTAIAVAAFMGLVGGFFPALRASRVSPAEAMRN
jgi:putative ABC transport system permease protein